MAFALSVTPPDPVPEMDKAANYKSLLGELPATVQSFSNTRPSLRNEIQTSYAYLRRTCPAMAKVDIASPWNLADWMNRKISPEEWRSAPYSFRMNSFRAVSVQNNSDTPDAKVELLGKIYDVLPSHPAFAEWVDERLLILNGRLQDDPIIRSYRDSWEWTQNRDSRLKKYFARVGELTVTTILPIQDYEPPAVTIYRERNGRRGRTSFDGKNVSFTIAEGGGISSAHAAETIAVHEYFHVVQVILRNWYAAGELNDSPAFSDMGEKFFYSWHSNLAFVSASTDGDIYRNTFLERWSYYAMNAANEPNEFHPLTRDPEWADRNLLEKNGQFHERGILPAACNLK